MANYFDNSQFSCRLCEAAPFKAATGSLDETTKQRTQMGLAHRHPAKSSVLQQKYFQRVFSCTGNMTYFYKCIGTCVSYIKMETLHFVCRGKGKLKIVYLFPWNVDFDLLGVEVAADGGCLKFYKPKKFKYGNGDGFSYNYNEKKKSLLVYICLSALNCHFSTQTCHSTGGSQPGNIWANHSLPSIVSHIWAWPNTLLFKNLIFTK